MRNKWNKNQKIDEEATGRILQEEDRVLDVEDWTRNLWFTILFEGGNDGSFIP